MTKIEFLLSGMQDGGKLHSPIEISNRRAELGSATRKRAKRYNSVIVLPHELLFTV